MDVDRRLYNLHRLYHTPDNLNVNCAYCRRIRTLNYGRYANFRNVLGSIDNIQRQPRVYPVLPHINSYDNYQNFGIEGRPNNRLPRINHPTFSINRNRNRNQVRRHNINLPSIDGLFEDVVVPTNLSLINNNSSLEIYIEEEEELCVICYDNIKKNDIVRKLKCNHIYHQKCCDKWLETHKKCPVCNDSLDN